MVAAGQGSRLGGGTAKSMRILGDKPLFAHALATLERITRIEGVVLAVPGNAVQAARQWIEKLRFMKVLAVVPGGKERGDSVQKGLQAITPDAQWIAIHDGARPFASQQLIDRVLDAALNYGAAIPVVPLADTIKEISDEKILHTIDRATLRGAQTPQIFDRQRLTEAYRLAADEGISATDDAAIVQRFTQGQIVIVDGEELNFKVTSPSDWLRAEDTWNRLSTQRPSTLSMGTDDKGRALEGE